MFIQKLTGCAAAAAIAAFISVGPTQAAMYPAVHFDAPTVHHVPGIHHVDCAVGLHLGPLGTCVIGTDDDRPPPPRERVIEHRSVDEGCRTKSVHHEDADGNSETHTKTNCD